MISCPSCSAENSDASKFCSKCGAALSPELAATITPENGVDGAGSSAPSSLSERSQHGRFLPGTKVADRYRIVALVGKGGMGEVYRADDLKLGHTVALKFLPRKLAEDPQRLEFFHSEVRLTRQISHPNVCRVYDIGEVDGQHFLSMEYVDGEDLQVLLRRIGRVSGDKGIEIAQQICAGLTAAHEAGVLHRDLKPANIMLDGRGRIRITDFGLAQLAEDAAAGEVAGTPAYMAPEQLARGQTTIQSDLYSLGLILYELFTSKRVHAGRSIDELRRAHDESTTNPSALVSDIDPAVERVILRCLEKEPHERPQSARSVSAALPGGDPLAAALAAGETPSPQMVAAAGQEMGLNTRGLIVALAGVFIGLPLSCWLADFTDPLNQAGLVDQTDAPAFFVAQANELVSEILAYDEPDDEAHGFQIDTEGDVEFWYRQRTGSFPILNQNYWVNWGEPSLTRPTFNAPRQTVPGELSLIMDADKRLRYFRALPVVEAKPRDIFSAPKPSEWPAWFTAETTGFVLATDEQNAGSEEQSSAELQLVTDRFRTPPDAYDDVRVWNGVDPENSREVYVEAAAFRGRPAYYETFSTEEFEEPLDFAARLRGSDSIALGRNITMGIYSCLLAAGALLAWHNLRTGRGDRRGALRLAGCVFCLRTLVWATYARHYADLAFEIGTAVTIGLSQILFDTAIAWLWYLGLEPFVRRIWPRVLIPWTRLLDGRWRNPLIGRDLLLGVLAGTASILLFRLGVLANLRFSDRPPNPIPTSPLALAGTKELLGTALNCHASSILSATFFLLVLLLMRIIFRNERRAIVGSLVIFAPVTTLMMGGNPAISVIPAVLHAGLSLTVLVRLGFLATVVQFATMSLLFVFPLTFNADTWYFSHGMFAVVWVTVVALFGFQTALRGQAGFALTAPNSR